MSRINGTRVVVAGIVAGFAMSMIGTAVNAMLLAPQWNAASKVLGIDLEATRTQTATGWVFMELLSGVAIAWVYAAILPRFGPGLVTGLRSGLVGWVLEGAALAAAFNGLYPNNLVVASALGALVGTCCGGAIVAALYRERAAS
jgi:hypothetical protein